MNVHDAILQRRAYRSIQNIPISDEVISELAEAARLAPSCFNNQPWRFVFVREQSQLERVFGALSKGNNWAFTSSMIVAVCCRKEDDCMVSGRDYFQFDTGMATAFLLLRATELGLLTHPIAGYSEQAIKEILSVPEDVQVITLIVMGSHDKNYEQTWTEIQIKSEKERPARKPLDIIARHETFA